MTYSKNLAKDRFY